MRCVVNGVVDHSNYSYIPGHTLMGLDQNGERKDKEHRFVAVAHDHLCTLMTEQAAE